MLTKVLDQLVKGEMPLHNKTQPAVEEKQPVVDLLQERMLAQKCAQRHSMETDKFGSSTGDLLGVG